MVVARLLAACALLATMLAVPAQAAPANDDFAGAAPLGFGGAAVADLGGATSETSEPRLCEPIGEIRQATVWYRIDVPVDMRVLFRSVGTDHNTAAYLGAAFDDLRTVGCGRSNLFTVGNEMWLHARAGEPVFVQVRGAAGDRFVVSVRPDGAGDITGTLTNSAGTPVPGICVFASARLGVLRSMSNADGRFTLTVPPGEYLIRFWDCSGGRHIGEYYDDVHDEAAAQVLTVRPGDVFDGIDATLLRTGLVRGTVADPEGRALSGICINGWPEGGAPGDVTGFAFRGEFWMQLAPGRYRLHIDDCSHVEPRFAGEWYDDQDSFSSAQWVTVLEDGDHVLNHVELQPG